MLFRSGNSGIRMIPLNHLHGYAQIHLEQAAERDGQGPILRGNLNVYPVPPMKRVGHSDETADIGQTAHEFLLNFRGRVKDSLGNYAAAIALTTFRNQKYVSPCHAVLHESHDELNVARCGHDFKTGLNELFNTIAYLVDGDVKVDFRFVFLCGTPGLKSAEWKVNYQTTVLHRIDDAPPSDNQPQKIGHVRVEVITSLRVTPCLWRPFHVFPLS